MCCITSGKLGIGSNYVKISLFLDVVSITCKSVAMFNNINIPMWFAVPVFILAGIGLLDRLLVPSVRWYLRRRVNRVIEQLNTRLQLGIQPFKLTRRKIMIDRLTHDPQVMGAVVEFSRDENIPPEIAHDHAERYAREIVPSFSAMAYFGIGIRLSRFVSNALYRVRVGFADDDALKKISGNATVIFVMNHRSNMDYVLVTFLAAQRSALSYAVGEWARVWPLQQLIRSMGAYFIRRKSRNTLYRKVLARYVQLATEGGVTQAIFPEGGLSTDGKLGVAKLGLLSYIVGDFNPDSARDVVFIPVGLNYDRVMEDRILTRSDDARRFRFNPMVFIGFVLKQIWLRVSGKFYRFGYACVSFGQPISLQSFRETHPENTTEALGAELMLRIGAVIPVLPVSLVSHVLLEQDGSQSRLEIKAECHRLWQQLAQQNIYGHIPRGDEDYAVDVGLRMLSSRHVITEQDGSFEIVEDQRNMLSYYANAIAHFFP